MKPLTIEQLKELTSFDYIYVVDKIKDFSTYAYKSGNTLGSNIRFVAFAHDYYLNDYGQVWLAYKNKEQAEAKGEIVELPCKVGDSVWYVYDFGSVAGQSLDIEHGTISAIFIRNTIQVECVYDSGLKLVHSIQQFNKLIFFNRVKAEAKLAELKGEKR